MGRCFDFLKDYYGFECGGNHGNQYTVAKEKIFTLPNSEESSNQHKQKGKIFTFANQNGGNKIRGQNLPSEKFRRTSQFPNQKECQNGTPKLTLDEIAKQL